MGPTHRSTPLSVRTRDDVRGDLMDGIPIARTPRANCRRVIGSRSCCFVRESSITRARSTLVPWSNARSHRCASGWGILIRGNRPVDAKGQQVPSVGSVPTNLPGRRRQVSPEASEPRAVRRCGGIPRPGALARRSPRLVRELAAPGSTPPLGYRRPDHADLPGA